MSRRPIQRLAAPLAILFSALLATTAARAQTTYTWNDSTTSWTTASAWTPNGPSDWFDGARFNDTVAFGNQATIANQPNLDGNVIVGGVTLDNTDAVWFISQSAGAFNIGSGGLTVTGSPNRLPGLNTTVSLPLDQTWTIGDGLTLTAYKTVSGSGASPKQVQVNWFCRTIPTPLPARSPLPAAR